MEKAGNIRRLRCQSNYLRFGEFCGLVKSRRDCFRCSHTGTSQWPGGAGRITPGQSGRGIAGRPSYQGMRAVLFGVHAVRRQLVERASTGRPAIGREGGTGTMGQAPRGRSHAAAGAAGGSMPETAIHRGLAAAFGPARAGRNHGRHSHGRPNHGRPNDGGGTALRCVDIAGYRDA